MNETLPISYNLALKAAKFINDNYLPQITETFANTPFDANLVISIALQESAQDWVGWIDNKTPDKILALCISDSSGDQPNTTRKAFPKNAADFEQKYGSDLTNMLIEEGNKYRAAKNWSARTWIYKAYGIFCYDLQAIEDDLDFFQQKQWYEIQPCLDRFKKELLSKYNLKKDLWLTVQAYNGIGIDAINYASNVRSYYTYLNNQS